MTVLAAAQRTSPVACMVEAVLKHVRDTAAARGVQIPGSLSTDIRWVGTPVMPCPGVLVSAQSVSASAGSLPGCVSIPEVRLVVQIGRGCQIAFEEDGTTNPRAALSTTTFASDDADLLWQIAHSLGVADPSVSFETNGGMLITSISLSVTEMDLTSAGASC